MEGELKVLAYRGGDGAKIRARCAKGSQTSVSACGRGVVYSGHYIMTGFRVANSAQYPWKLQYNFMIVPTPCPTMPQCTQKPNLHSSTQVAALLVSVSLPRLKREILTK